MYKNRLNIFTGHFGSGKTEVSINFAKKLKNQLTNKIALIDLDIVNPYFRTADLKNYLEEKDFLVIAPIYANTNIDIPAIPPQVNSIFDKKEITAIFDVGGDNVGARILSRYNKYFTKSNSYEMFFVINTNRPETSSKEKIIDIISSIEEASRLKVSKLINNSNLLTETTFEHLIKGLNIINEVKDATKIPIAFTSTMVSLTREQEKEIGVDILYMNKKIKLPWDKE